MTHGEITDEFTHLKADVELRELLTGCLTTGGYRKSSRLLLVLGVQTHSLSMETTS